MPNAHAQRRRKILEAAEKLFRHYGPAKTTIADIAREVGIGVGSVYLEFRCKDAIVRELSIRRHDRVVSAMTTAAREGSAADRFSAAMLARIDALYRLADEGAHACDLVLCPDTAGSGNGSARAFRDEELAVVSALLVEGTAAGELAVRDPRRTAELIQRIFATLSPPALFRQERNEAKTLASELCELLLDGLRARPGDTT